MYCELKNEELWIWSNRLASLDCMPQYKLNADNSNDALLDVCAINQLTAQKKKHVALLARNRAAYKIKTNKGVCHGWSC